MQILTLTPITFTESADCRPPHYTLKSTNTVHITASQTHMFLSWALSRPTQHVSPTVIILCTHNWPRLMISVMSFRCSVTSLVLRPPRQSYTLTINTHSHCSLSRRGISCVRTNAVSITVALDDDFFMYVQIVQAMSNPSSFSGDDDLARLRVFQNVPMFRCPSQFLKVFIPEPIHSKEILSDDAIVWGGR